MIKILLYVTVILLFLAIVFFIMWKIIYSKYQKLKNECEELTRRCESYQKVQEIQVRERIEIEKKLQASVGNGNSDSFNSSIDLLQKLATERESGS